MPKSNVGTNRSSLCDFVPGYAYYDGIGYSLAEKLADLFEFVIGLIGKIKK